MRTLFVTFIVVFACFAVSCCGSSPVGSLAVSKTVMDDTKENSDNSRTSDNGDGGETEKDYIWYDSEGDYFDD